MSGPAAFTVAAIGVVRSPYTETSQIPKGPGAEHHAEGVLELLPEFEPGLLDIDGFSHLYVLWLFDRVTSVSLTATPPTDTRPHGVFATRSPHRPNGIGLLTVELLGREGTRLRVKGVDVLDGTPVLDIKPYLTHFDCRPEASRGWVAGEPTR